MSYTVDKAYELLSDVGITTIEIKDFGGMNPKSTLVCKICQRTWSGRISSIIQHRRVQTSGITTNGCPYCRHVDKGKSKRDKSRKSFEEKILLNPTLHALTPYISAKKPIKIHCDVCDRTYTTTPDALPGHKAKRDNSVFRCPKCGEDHNQGNQRTEQEFLHKFNSMLGDSFKYVTGTYKKSHSPAKFICKKCNNAFWRKPANFMAKKSKCPYCSPRGTMTQSMFEDTMVKEYGIEYTVLSSYVDTRTKILLKHNICGNVWKVRPDTILARMSSCPFCSSISKGERAVAKLLDRLGVEYTYQKTFPWCADKNKLPYDFYLPEFNSIIEVDGKQHIKDVPYFSRKTSFEAQVRHDIYKSKVAEEHGIPIVRIPYYDSDPKKVENMLYKLLQAII